MSAAGARGNGRPSESGLVVRLCQVYIGPDAGPALAGRWGLLQGQKRPGWIDVLGFSPRRKPRASAIGALRFDASTAWPVVGLSLPEIDWRRDGPRLLRELVPGDVVVTERGARVHLGQAFAVARLLVDAGRAR